MEHNTIIELEHNLEERCVAKVERMGGEAVKLQILGKRGWPDRTVLLPCGRVFFVEFKRKKRGRVSAQQAMWIKVLSRLGFAVYIIDNDKDFDIALKS